MKFSLTSRKVRHPLGKLTENAQVRIKGGLVFSVEFSASVFLDPRIRGDLWEEEKLVMWLWCCHTWFSLVYELTGDELAQDSSLFLLMKWKGVNNSVIHHLIPEKFLSRVSGPHCCP